MIYSVYSICSTVYAWCIERVLFLARGHRWVARVAPVEQRCGCYLLLATFLSTTSTRRQLWGYY